MPPVSSASPAPRLRLSMQQTFDAARQSGRLALLPFIPAGYPDIATTAALLPAMEKAGANVIEIGFPFSDPVADGPVIQEAFTYALAKHVKVADVLAAVRTARKNVSIPIVGMLSYSIVYRYGVERFARDANAAGLDGLIIPDLPPPEAQEICAIIRAADLETCLLVAPTTATHRRAEIAKLSSGFVYYLSVSGITGERDRLPADLGESVRGLKSLTDRPVCVGFGISKPHHVAMLKGMADGAIVGSAVVRQIKAHLDSDPQTIVTAVQTYLQDLMR